MNNVEIDLRCQLMILVQIHTVMSSEEVLEMRQQALCHDVLYGMMAVRKRALRDRLKRIRCASVLRSN